MNLHTLRPAPGSTKRRKRVGRGNGSGKGTYCGKGRNGQQAHGHVPRGFEGGQTPLHRRLPLRRGFTRFGGPEYGVVNVGALDAHFPDGAEITADMIVESGLVKREMDGVRVLGGGEVTKKLVVKAKHFSDTAKEKLEKAGGRWEVV
jgi:large subunit ribosomal protein L15